MTDKLIFKDIFLEYLIANKLEVVSRGKNIDQWNEMANNLAYVPYSYTNAWLDYFCEYEKVNYSIVEDCSVILKQNNESICILPAFLLINKDTSKNICKSFLPLFINLDKKISIKKLFKKYFKAINEFCKKNNIENIEIKIPFLNDTAFPIWGYEYLKSCDNYNIIPEIYVNLQLLHSEIVESIRSTTMHRINKSINKYKVRILDGYNLKLWQKFKSLHFDSAQRMTRTEKSWDVQLQNIKNKNAIYLYIENQNNELMCGCFFDFSNNECNYSVSVTDANNKDKSLNHLILYASILILKKKKIKFLRLGDILLPCDLNMKDDKRDNILLFKEAFYTDVYLSYSLNFKSSKFIDD